MNKPKRPRTPGPSRPAAKSGEKPLGARGGNVRSAASRTAGARPLGENKPAERFGKFTPAGDNQSATKSGRGRSAGDDWSTARPDKAKSFGERPHATKSARGRSLEVKPAADKMEAAKSVEAKQETAWTVEAPTLLLDFLLNAMAGKGRNAVKSILSRGQVSVDGRQTKRHDIPLAPGQQVTISWKRVPDGKSAAFLGLSILHEDDDVIVVHKDAGLLSIATEREKELTAYRQLSDHVRRADSRSRIFVVHRLDRDTSGVMMFAKSEAIQQKLQQDWQDSVKERSYIALVEGTVATPEGTVRSWLKENKAMIMYSSSKPDDGQLAVTHYKTLETGTGYSLLEVHLETGRKNQIRVHMKDIGHPIVGDKKYGAHSGPIQRLGLHAHVLAFRHPRSGKALRFESPVPPAFMRVFKERS